VRLKEFNSCTTSIQQLYNNPSHEGGSHTTNIFWDLNHTLIYSEETTNSTRVWVTILPLRLIWLISHDRNPLKRLLVSRIRLPYLPTSISVLPKVVVISRASPFNITECNPRKQPNSTAYCAPYTSAIAGLEIYCWTEHIEAITFPSEFRTITLTQISCFLRSRNESQFNLMMATGGWDHWIGEEVGICWAFGRIWVRVDINSSRGPTLYFTEQLEVQVLLQKLVTYKSDICHLSY
jgi:hypothetical protein